MLTMKKKITLDGFSTVGEVKVMGFRAEIDSDNPENMTFSSWPIDKAAYKEHRVEVRADEAAFEDEAYLIQDEMIAEKAAESN